LPCDCALIRIWSKSIWFGGCGTSVRRVNDSALSGAARYGFCIKRSEWEAISEGLPLAGRAAEVYDALVPLYDANTGRALAG
jgi:hypothetical protein